MNKFNLLFEQIIKELQIPIDSFQFEFKLDDQNNILCEFDALGTDSKLERIKIKIDSNKEQTIIVQTNGIQEKISEKQFLLKYYSYYERFKKALAQFEDDMLNDLKEKKSAKNEIPKTEIIPFEDKLQDLTQQTKTFNVDGISFEIRYKSGFNTEKAVQINFGFVHTNEQNVSSKLDAVVIVRLNKNDDKQITKIRLTEFEINTYITETLFKNKYPKVFETLSKVVKLI